MGKTNNSQNRLLLMRIKRIMNNYHADQPNGYLESIQKGLAAVHTYDLRVSHGDGSRDEQIARLKNLKQQTLLLSAQVRAFLPQRV